MPGFDSLIPGQPVLKMRASRPPAERSMAPYTLFRNVNCKVSERCSKPVLSVSSAASTGDKAPLSALGIVNGVDSKEVYRKVNGCCLVAYLEYFKDSVVLSSEGQSTISS